MSPVRSTIAGMSDLTRFSPTFEAFAGECSAAAIQRQDVLNGHLGTVTRHADLAARTLTGDDLRLGGVTSLGSFSHLSQTWLWSWENPNFSWEHPAVAPTRMLYDFGGRQGIPELITGHIDLSGFPDPHGAATTMAIAAAHLLGGNGVWSCRINDGQGSAYVHLDDPQLPVARFDPMAAPGLLMRAAEVFPTDHRRIVRGYFEYFEVPFTDFGDRIIGGLPDLPTVAVAFSDRNLITVTSVGK
jgi:hypothetical protein